MRQVIAVFCLLLVSGGWAQSTNIINRCVHSGGQLPLSVIVHGCFDAPCAKLPLQELVTDVIFLAPRNISQMTTQATASFNVGNIQLNVPLDLGEVARTCDFLTLPSSCPIQGTEIVQYHFRMLIQQFFAVDTQTNLEIRTVDNDFNNAVIWCFRLPIRILEPLPTVSSANEGGEGEKNRIEQNNNVYIPFETDVS